MASCTGAVVQRNVTASTVTAKESMFPVDALATQIAKPAVADVLTVNAQNAAVVQTAPAATPGILSPPGINAGPQKHVDVTGHATRHILTDARPDISATVITAHRDARVARPMGGVTGTSVAGTIARTGCYVGANTMGRDNYGAFEFTGNSYYCD